MKRESFSRFDVLDYLRSEADISAYLHAALEDDDPQSFVVALGDVVRARNVTRVAKDAGLTREGVYKALSPSGNPSFATVWNVARALQMRVTVQAAPAAKTKHVNAQATRKQMARKSPAPKRKSR